MDMDWIWKSQTNSIIPYMPTSVKRIAKASNLVGHILIQLDKIHLYEHVCNGTFGHSRNIYSLWTNAFVHHEISMY